MKLYGFQVLILCLIALTVIPTIASASDEEERSHQRYGANFLQVELVEPAYKASIYSTQPHKRIVLRVSKKVELLGDAPITIALHDPEGKVLAEQVVRDAGESAVFDAVELAPGRYSIKAVTELYGHPIQQTAAVTVLPPADHEVMFDVDGICHFNGRPFFPLGLYHVGGRLDEINMVLASRGEGELTKQQMFESVKAKGFNLIVPWNVGDASNLEMAARYDMKVMQGSDRSGEGFVQWIKQIRHHPALLAVAIVDEPWTEHVFNEARRRYAVMQELDLYHPVQITECYSDLYAAAAATCDLLAIDSYPLRDNAWWAQMDWWDGERWQSPLRLVSRYTEQGMAVVGPRRPLWWVVQAFGYGSWQIPTGQQVRHQAYSAIVGGARGLLFYAYASGETNEAGDIWWIEDHPDLWEACGQLNEELHALMPVLLAAGGEASLRCDGADDIRYLKREVGDTLYIIAVNIGETEQRFDVAVPEALRNVKRWGDGREVKLTSGRLVETFEPFDIAVYELAK